MMRILNLHRPTTEIRLSVAHYEGGGDFILDF